MSEDEKRTSLDPEVEKALPPALADAIRSGSVPENILKHSHDADEAMKAFEGHQGEVLHIDEATNKRLLRLIDWNLIPVSEQLQDHTSEANSSGPDHVCGVWSELSGQNHNLICQRYGHQEGYRPCRGRLPMAGLNVL